MSTTIIKKRRKNLNEENNGSSREASAESNDETELSEEGGIESELDHSILISPTTFNAAKHHLIKRVGGGSSSSHQPSSSSKLVSENGLLGLEGQQGEGEISEGHDGDISSATAPSHSHHSHSKIHHPKASSSSSSTHLDTTTNLAEEEDESISPSGIITSSNSLPLRHSSPPLIHSININVPTPPPVLTGTGNGYDESTPPSPHQSPRAVAASRYPGHGGEEAPPAWQSAPTGFLANLTAEDIQDHIKTAIAGDSARAYKIMAPPQGRPVRIYADGVYDLLHYGHMLQLRQCKLAFPSVHLMVGVCSSSLVRKYKAPPVLTSEERYESVRHCKWVDEVVEDAPWTVDEAFLREHAIDYVAHDEEPYMSAGSDDVYAYAKSIGAFLPTKRTNGVSTSELLQRIVEGYREGEFDGKFIKLDRPDLCSTRAPSEAGTSKSRDPLESSTFLVPPEKVEEEKEELEVEVESVEEKKKKKKETEVETTEELLRKLEVNA